MSEMIRFEVVFFITAFLCGIGLLIGYDIIRIVRRVVLHSSFIVAVEDMLFWAVSGILVFYMMYEKNNGIVRGIALVSLFFGMFCYHYTISGWLVKWISRMILIPIQKIVNIKNKILKKCRKTVKLIDKKQEWADEPERGGQDGKK